MSISLIGLTLHVADVERSLNFYKRLPDSSILFHMPGKFALLKVGSGRLGLLQDQKRPFHVEIDCQDLDATCVLLKKSGFQLEGPTTRAPEDEYDSYIGPVYRILSGSRSEQELIDFLFRTERDTIGVSCESPEQLRPVARRLLDLDVSL